MSPSQDIKAISGSGPTVASPAPRGKPGSTGGKPPRRNRNRGARNRNKIHANSNGTDSGIVAFGSPVPAPPSLQVLAPKAFAGW